MLIAAEHAQLTVQVSTQLQEQVSQLRGFIDPVCVNHNCGWRLFMVPGHRQPLGAARHYAGVVVLYPCGLAYHFQALVV